MEVINECLNDFKDNAVFTEDDDTVALDEAGIFSDLQGVSRPSTFFT